MESFMNFQKKTTKVCRRREQDVTAAATNPDGVGVWSGRHGGG